jgi:hypothetical protein
MIVVKSKEFKTGCDPLGSSKKCYDSKMTVLPMMMMMMMMMERCTFGI